jgi:site-specific DNA recombinase
LSSCSADVLGESHTAHRRGRPIFTHVMDLIEADKANGLLVWHANRIARNAWDGGRVITAMDEGKLLEVKTSNGKTYRNTPEDKFFLQFEFNMAKKSSDDNSVAVKRGLKTKLNLGWYPARAPLGYLNTKNFEEKGQNYILKDPDRFDSVRRMWDYMVTGNYTPPQILEIVNKEWKFKTRQTKRAGGKPLARSTIYRIFTNSFYCGMFEYGRPKQLFKGEHEAMITEKEFDQVQKFLGRDGRPRPQSHRFVFTGLMKCGNCGASITAEEKIKRQKNGNVHYYVYYHCTRRKDKNCPERMVKLEVLNAEIDEVVKNLVISDDFRDWSIKYLHEVRQNQAKNNQSVLDNKQKSFSRVTEQLQTLILKYTAPENANEEIMNVQEFQLAKQSLIKQKTALEGDLTKHGKKIIDWLDFSERAFNFARYSRMWFNKGNPETKRAVFAALGSHLIIKDRNLTAELHPYFKTISKDIEKVENEIIKVRTSEIFKNSRDFAKIMTECPTLRRKWDSNPRTP